MIQKLYEEGLQYGLNLYQFEGKDVIFYKGFKLSKCNDSCVIHDVRINDFYDNITEEASVILSEHGLIKGADLLSYDRNLRRVEKYSTKIAKLYAEKEKLEENDLITGKRYDNCQEGIYKYTDLLFFYRVKVKQYEQKYNLNLTNNEQNAN